MKEIEDSLLAQYKKKNPKRFKRMKLYGRYWFTFRLPKRNIMYPSEKTLHLIINKLIAANILIRKKPGTYFFNPIEKKQVIREVWLGNNSDRWMDVHNELIKAQEEIDRFDSLKKKAPKSIREKKKSLMLEWERLNQKLNNLKGEGRTPAQNDVMHQNRIRGWLKDISSEIESKIENADPNKVVVLPYIIVDLTHEESLKKIPSEHINSINEQRNKISKAIGDKKIDLIMIINEP